MRALSTMVAMTIAAQGFVCATDARAAQSTAAVPAKLVQESVVFAFNLDASVYEGSTPEGGITIGTDGNLYGTTYLDNYYGGGTVFELTPAGALTTLHFFCVGYDYCPDGDVVQGTLLLASDGSFYGLTDSGGGEDSAGTFFNVTSSGSFSTLTRFETEPTEFPNPMLTLGSDGNYYGTTDAADGIDTTNGGTVFKLTPQGALTTLYVFTPANDETGVNTGGAYPVTGAIVQAGDGNFYGMTNEGGQYGSGVLYQITPEGTFTDLHDFGAKSDGALPIGGLIVGTDGNLYGTTARTGNGAAGNSAIGYGTVFKATLSGTVTILHTFKGPDGGFPQASLMQGKDGYFYGTTNGGGTGGNGTVFRISSNGVFLSLYSFAAFSNEYDDNATGALPGFGALTADGQGNLYGTTQTGGPYAGGVVYKINAAVGH